MKFAAVRLVVAAALFLGWIGYLGYLAATTRPAVVLSRPQFLVSQRDVVATYKGGQNFIVDEVLYPKNAPDADRGKTVVVHNLGQCWLFSPENGWVSEKDDHPVEGRRYLLALQSAAAPNPPDAMDVVPIPPSPGYSALQPYVYPDTPEVRRQYAAVPKP